MFGDRLKLVLAVRNVTQSKLGKAIGIHSSAISNWVNGKNEPSSFSELLPKLVKYFNVEPQVFLYDECATCWLNTVIKEPFLQNLHSCKDMDFCLKVYYDSLKESEMDN